MGFQIQHALPTIELEITKAFQRLLNVEVKIIASGRTDRYVHARGQVFHVDLDQELPPLGLMKGLNALLPSDIYISACDIVSEDFHARFSVVKKEYRYYINTHGYDPFTIRYLPYIPNLNISKMQLAMTMLEGTHDFKGFASGAIHEKKSTVRTIFQATMIEHPMYLEFSFLGDGFLKYQVRRMMGLIIEIGKGKEEPEKINEVLAKKNSQISHKVAEGCGLYLQEVTYLSSES